MKSILSALILTWFVVPSAFASFQEIECQDAGNVVKFDLSSSARGHLDWISDGTPTDGGSITIHGESKKHPGYTVYSGETDTGGTELLFELPTTTIGESEAIFTGYFYDLEKDGGPDVPMGFTMNCLVK